MKNLDEGLIQRYLIPDAYALARRLAADPIRRPAETLRVLKPALLSLRDIGLTYRALWDILGEEFPELAETHGYTFNGFYAWANRNLGKTKANAGGKSGKEPEGNKSDEPSVAAPSEKFDIFRRINKKKEQK